LIENLQAVPDISAAGFFNISKAMFHQVGDYELIK
jgi:hypothetical protein